MSEEQNPNNSLASWKDAALEGGKMILNKPSSWGVVQAIGLMAFVCWMVWMTVTSNIEKDTMLLSAIKDNQIRAISIDEQAGKALADWVLILDEVNNSNIARNEELKRIARALEAITRRQPIPTDRNNPLLNPNDPTMRRDLYIDPCTQPLGSEMFDAFATEGNE